MPPRDPNATHRGPARHGGVGRPTGVSAPELGTVTIVDTERYAYCVRTLAGQNLSGLQRKRSSASDLATLPVGTTVLIRYDINFPYIDGVFSMPAEEATDTGIPVAGGSSASTNALTQNYGTGTFRANGEPSDLVAGDDVTGNTSGARVGVLEGGMAVLMGSLLSQIRAHSLRNLIEIIARNFRLVTDMGEFKIDNRDGRVNMSFRGASDQASEAGATEQTWTIRMDLGSIGDLFNFELTTPQGQTLFKMHVDSNGRCNIFGLDGVVLQSGARSGEPAVTEQGGNSRDIVRGDRAVETGGNATSIVEGDNARTVDGNELASIGNDSATSTVRDYSVAAGRDVLVTAGGKHTTAVNDGDCKTTVGQTSKPNGNYSVETLRGRILLKSLQGGNIELETSTGQAKVSARKIMLNATGSDSVVLGGEALVAHLARFEQLEVLVNAMFTHFDAHTHAVPALGTSGIPTVGMKMVLGRLVSAIKSLRVGVAG